jgi:hypothetical protein
MVSCGGGIIVLAEFLDLWPPTVAKVARADMHFPHSYGADMSRTWWISCLTVESKPTNLEVDKS